MNMNKAEILGIVRAQLALDLNCDARDFLKDGVTFCRAALNEGRRLFDRKTPYLEAATMGKGIVVSADAGLLERVRPLLEGRDRDDLFFAPFFYGHSLYYVPESGRIAPRPEGFELHVAEGRDVHALYAHPGFNNAVSYDERHPRPDVLAVYAAKGGEIVGMAGASADSAAMWQIGIDVLPPFRGQGLAAHLVSRLATMILERGAVPYYGTASSNVASQAVAHRSGLAPAWMCTYRHTLEGTGPYAGESHP